MAIILPSGFNITNVDPIDSRSSVADASARLGFSAANVYEGLVVYQQDTNELYVLTNTGSYNSNAGWTLVGSNISTGSFAVTGSNTFIGNQIITGSLNVTQGITGSLFGTASYATTSSYLIQAVSSSYSVSSSLAQTASFIATASWASNSVTASYVRNAVSASFSSTASYTPNYLSLSGGTITGNLIIYGTASISYLNVNYESASIIYSSGSNQFGDATNDTQTLIGTVFVSGSQQITGSLNVSQGITGSLFGTASYSTQALSSSYSNTSTSASFAQTSSYALNAQSASYATIASSILGGKATHIPYFITDTTLATSSLYQSGSSTVIINQDNATTANPEALYVWQPSSTSINVISGKGNLNNYLQLNIQNTNQGVSASSDVVATANNGTETTNYIDMGINSENYSQNYIGAANDAYLYSTGNDLHIGNATPNKPLQFFVGGTDVDIYNKLQLNPNNQHTMSGSLEISGSLNVRNTLTSSGLLTNGTNTILGNTVMSGSSTIQGTTTMTGSLLISGSTTQRGNNTLLGNTILSGSIIISGSENPSIPTIQIYGDTQHSGVVRFNPIARNIDTSISASYIYVSGSTSDLYFSQNGNGYANTTRLRWLEGNLYTGLLNGGLITTQSSTVYQIGSGSGIVVNLNASYNNNPYPTVTYVNWSNLSASIAPLSASYDQQFVSVQSNGTIFAQGTPYAYGEYDTLIPIGIVIHQNRSTINAVQTFPSVAYGFKQRTDDFIKAFGPVKISGYTLSPSGSSTGSLVLSGGTAYVDGRNYIVDPNSPSYVTELNGITTSKIYRYYQSGSADWKYVTNAGVGYATIDPTQYSLNGTLTALSNNNRWSIQRVYYFPNSATKAFYIYYGNAEYDTKADAIAALTTEPFNEAPNTAANALFIGYMLLQKIADFTSTATYEFRAAGLFRGSGTAIGGGSATSTALSGLSDVSITSPANNNLLAYNSSTLRWENVASITANVTGNLTGTATTASYISPTFISASAAASGFGSGGGGGTGDYVASSWTGSNTSQFAGTASFATTAQNLLGSIASAATASYATSFVIGTGGTLTLDGNLIDASTVSSTIVGSNNLFTLATGSYTSAHGKYTIFKGANSRAGEFVTSWNGTTTSYYDNSTVDIGDTADIVFQSSIVTSQIQINAVAATSGWTVKMLATYL
jgi:hypothetical protein